MTDELPLLFERISAHLNEPVRGSALADLEHTLTDGYAGALALEAEQGRAERSIADLAERIDDPVRLVELRELSERRTRAEADLTRLRALLELLRQRVAEQRAAFSS